MEEEKEETKTALQNKCMYCDSAFEDSVKLTHHLMKELRERATKKGGENTDIDCKKKEVGVERDLDVQEELDVKREVDVKRDLDVKKEVDVKRMLDVKEELGVKRELNMKTEQDVKKELDVKVEVILKEEDPEKKFSRSTYFRRKRRIKEETGQDNYKCIYCGLVCPSHKELKIHKQRYKDFDQNTICPEPNCGATFSNNGGRYISRSLKAHMNKHIGLNIDCPNCGKVFFSDGQLRLHMKLESKLTFQCEQCPQVFISKEGLQRHISQRKFNCKDCNLRFKALYVLQRHIQLSHEDVLEFVQCTLCEKIFKTDNAIQVHTRAVHNKERKYECNVCGYKFFSKFKMGVHFQRKHTKPASPPVCKQEEFSVH